VPKMEWLITSTMGRKIARFPVLTRQQGTRVPSPSGDHSAVDQTAGYQENLVGRTSKISLAGTDIESIDPVRMTKRVLTGAVRITGPLGAGTYHGRAASSGT
jgi:hypothetical protein